ALGKERRFNGLKLQWGLDQFIPLEAFNDSTNGYLVKDTCVFGAEVFVKERSRVKGECLSMEKYAYSSKYVWKIDNFSKLGAGYKESQAFGAGNHKWKIELHPAGIDIGAADHLSMFLILENFTVENVQVYAEFTLRIWDQLGQSMNLFKVKCVSLHAINKFWFHTPKSSWGCPRFVSLSELNDPETGFLVNDVCVVEAEVTVLGISEPI
ncbi:hypothetical protein CISIN_1g046711mg, partial [Citrus sinensis]